MSISKLSTGDGYAYYTAMTASGDERRAAGQELTDYYVETGAPEGRWVGRGCAGLGVNGAVREDQMKALFGEGRHPEADRIEAEIIASGGSAKDAELASRLGRRPARFATPSNELARRIKDATASREERLGRSLTVDETRQVRMQEAAREYIERFGHRPEDNKELAVFLSKELGKGSNPVAGYDLTFSPPKSVSVLWGLSDEATSDAIAQAHEAAIADTLQWLEKHAIGSRSGAGGVAHIDVKGLIATQFRHHDSREGDPQLHDHVVIANKVQDATSGKWLSLDGAALYRNVVAASEHYNRAIVEHVSRLGYTFEARPIAPGKRPVMEVAGVDSRLLSSAAKRSAKIRARVQELAAEYTEKHGRTPDKKVMHQLRQQATLETRTPKAEHRSLAQMRTEWAAEAASVVGDEGLEALTRTALEAGHGARERAEAVRDGLDIIGAGEAVIEELASRRSTWAERDIRAEVERWAGRNHGELLTDFQREAITQYARDVASVNLTPPSTVPVFSPLTRADGRSIYEPRDRNIYSSNRMIEAEYRLLDAARQGVIPPASAATFDRILADQTMSLDAGQIELARAFACGEQALTVGIGPAGAGKTTAMKLAVETIQADGGRVVGLAVAATAAAQLEDATGAESTTLAQWQHYRRRAADGQAVPERFTLNAGDVVIVDEAGMAGTLSLDEIVQDAADVGAHVRLIGDDRQLQAVESGGALRMIAAEAGAVHLTQIHRFRDPAEAEASLALRHGDLSWYDSAGRVHSGRREDLIESLVRAWDTDDAEGLSSLMMADTNDQVAVLNGRAQELRIARGQVDLEASTALRDGHRAGVGDRVVTRRVDRSLTIEGTRDCVKNGDVWTVDRVGDDGSLAVRREDGKTITLPPEYVESATELGYASTVHRAQGRTVDVARALAGTATSREGLYVAMTRGRRSNELFVATDEQSREQVLARITSADRRDVAARDAMLAEAERVDSPAELARQHQDVTDRADALRYTAHLRDAYGAEAEKVIAGDARSAVDAALRRAEDAGYDVPRLLERHQDVLTDSEDPTALLSWRIRRDLERGRAQAADGTHRPLREVPRERLAELAEQSGQRLAQARETLAVHEARHSYDAKPLEVDGTTIPAWTDRDQGTLTSAELDDRIGLARWLVADSQEREAAAASDLRALSVQWRTQRGRGTSITDVRMQRLAGDIQDAQTRLDGARETTRGNRVELETLRRESRLRHRMSPRQWCLEETQRAMQRQRGVSDREHVTQRAANTLSLEEARRVHDREAVMSAAIRAEVRRRAVEPDTTPTQPADAIPRWLAPDRGLADDAMPQAWRDHLAQRRAIIADRLAARGRALADGDQQWTRDLGPVPEAGTPERARWERSAAEVDTWRELHDWSDEQRALPPVQEVPAADRADLTALRGHLAAPTPRPAAKRSSSLGSMKDRVRAQRQARETSTLAEGQDRSNAQQREHEARQHLEQQQGKGPVQR